MHAYTYLITPKIRHQDKHNKEGDACRGNT